MTTSLRKIEANRRNARKSTGPRTTSGKLRSRHNAVRHGLTASILANSDEADVYRAFERQLMVDFLPRSGIQRELVERLASLLWRLRRATAIENGLLRIQQKVARERTLMSENPAELSPYDLRTILRPQQPSEVSEESCEQAATAPTNDVAENAGAAHAGSLPGTEGSDPPTNTVALAFLRLANLDNHIFERLGRYETRLWRQAAQTLLLIESIAEKEQ